MKVISDMMCFVLLKNAQIYLMQRLKIFLGQHKDKWFCVIITEHHLFLLMCLFL